MIPMIKAIAFLLLNLAQIITLLQSSMFTAKMVRKRAYR